MKGFDVSYRGPGHWDVYVSGGARAFCIRGGPGEWYVRDERDSRHKSMGPFKEQSQAMSYICSEMMFELLTVDGQQPIVMASWNIS